MIDRRLVARGLGVALPLLGAATIAVGYLEDSLGVPNASAVYLVAVVAVAYASGIVGAVLASVASFLLYDFFFTAPRYQLTIADPGVWLSAVLLLFVGIVVGQLAALQRSRAQVARDREREALALFKVSRALATRSATLAVLPEVTESLLAETRSSRVWIALGSDDGSERVAADSGAPSGEGSRPEAPGVVNVLARKPGEQPAEWIRVHRAVRRAPGGSGDEAFRVRMEAGGTAFGSIWSLRARGLGVPDGTETRLLSAAADQIAQALAQDRLAAESQAAEIARQSDALKSALLQSVSHDLRTPLATIRAAAGALRPASGLSAADQQESSDAIDREVEYLDRLVTNLLDLSRIEAGALRSERGVFELDDLVARTIERLRARLANHDLEVEVPALAVDVDPVFLDEALTNVLDNAVKYTPPGTVIRVSARALPDDGLVRLTVEDAGPGVPADTLSRLFEKFYRVPGSRTGSRSGTGIGLAVVRGLIEATAGRVRARSSELGGLAVDLEIPTAEVPAGIISGEIG